jgi:hypothetical protein
MRSGLVLGAALALAGFAGLTPDGRAWAGPTSLLQELGIASPTHEDTLYMQDMGILARTGQGAGPREGTRPQDVPEIFGPGKVTTFGNVWMKVTNIGCLGNPFTATSSDPSGQWPGASGVEYLFAAYLYVGAKDASVSDPTLLRRVSSFTEWRPPTAAPKDHIYFTFDGAPGGARFTDDDNDGRIDEDPLDGNDDDGDGAVDEDYGAISQQEFTCLQRDDTPAAVDAPTAEKHSPRGLQVRQNTYTFSVPGANDFTSIEWEIENISNHVLDSVYVGIRADQDVGPISKDRYYSDDLPEPRFPQGPDPTIQMLPTDPQNPNLPYLNFIRPEDPVYQGGLCALDTTFVHGVSLVDDDGDNGLTLGSSTIVLLGHTIDPTGRKAPRRVGLSMAAFFAPGVPYIQGGSPTNDQERYEAMASGRGIDPTTGLNNIEAPDRGEIGDYSNLLSVGPFLDFQPGEKITVAWALAVQAVDYTKRVEDIPNRYRACIDNAIQAEKTYRGAYEQRQGLDVPGPEDFGKETCIRKVPGGPIEFADCHDDSLQATRPLLEQDCTWFDLDCNYCTGVPGYLLKRWTASAPPPSPQMTAVAGDRQVELRWSNRSEYTPDPAKGVFDIAGYKVWKASNWSRPVGSTGPGDDLWSLLGTYYLYDPRSFSALKDRAANGGDSLVARALLLNRETGQIIYPEPDTCPPDKRLPDGTCDTLVVPCEKRENGDCDTAYAQKLVIAPSGRDSTIARYPVVKYPIGRYRLVDHSVINGFTYFYSVTAFDSTGRALAVAKLEGRQAAVEGDGVVPQESYSTASNGGEPFVVPNPYRGRADWDLTPNATDPTGTHVDFFNLPPCWSRIGIYTVSGDLVQEIRPGDSQVNGRQQREGAADAQASWNLVSRNGQDIVSGIYIFSVEASNGSGCDGRTRRGKFVVIR